MSERRQIYCCACGGDVPARLTNGSEVYPHRKDLRKLPFWRCDECGNFVGCHHKTKDYTRPLGCIPSPEIKRARRHIHNLLDPLWKNGYIDRGDLYDRLADCLGLPEYHTAEIRTISDAREVYRHGLEIAKKVAI